MALQVLCSIYQVWKVEVGNVIADDHIWINFFEKVPPAHKHLLLRIVLEDLRVYNETAGVQAKDISDKRFRVAIPRDNISNLNYGVHLRLWKDSLAACTFNVKGQNPEGSHLGPFAVVWVSYQVFVVNVRLDLTIGMSLSLGYHCVFPSFRLHPRHACDL